MCAFCCDGLQVKSLYAHYEKECAARRQLQSKLVAAGGNIRVYCRVRPRNADEVRARRFVSPLRW